MGPKIINKVVSETSPNTTTTTTIVKAKRGRKSKKELMASLNMDYKTINLCVQELKPENTVTHSKLDDSNNEQNVYTNIFLQTSSNEQEQYNKESNIVIIENPSLQSEEQKPQLKKRGRKPKGGKIIHHVVSNEPLKEDKPNVILHLKCSMKDLNVFPLNDKCTVESFSFSAGKGDLYNSVNNLQNFDLIGSENINTVNTFFNEKTNNNLLTGLQENTSWDDEEEEVYCKDTNKEIWKKLKQLENNLHINNVNNKRSACFWDTCEFDNPPIYIPKHFINSTYHVYGCFCSPECGVAYLMNENIDSSAKFERYHLFNHIYSKIYDFKKNIKPAPNPFYMLEKYYGNLSIQEYRSLLRNERLFLIVDKPLTRILPELHEDNDDFILNNKIIPSNNNYQVKSRLQKKKQNKNSILNEKFGITNQALLE
jgi:hypothetical protein